MLATTSDQRRLRGSTKGEQNRQKVAEFIRKGILCRFLEASVNAHHKLGQTLLLGQLQFFP